MIIYAGFCGRAGAGKTTICNILEEMHGGPSVILPWAYELKRIARDEFGWDGNKDEKGRKLLQVLGTECGRMYGGDLFWVNRWQSRIDIFIASNSRSQSNILVLNDDTRFDSEARHIREKGGVVIEVVGRETDLGINSSHSSEKGISSCYIDHQIDNSGSMEELREKLQHVYRRML